MTCVEVRDRLPEHALGLLAGDEAETVERHLALCAGCWKEYSELVEGSTAVAMALASAEPPLSLENKVVQRITTAAGTRVPASHRRRMRALVASTLAAAFVAVGALGWAFAERGRVVSLQKSVHTTSSKLSALAGFLQKIEANGQVSEAKLFPVSGTVSSGTAIVFSAPSSDDFALIEVVPPATKAGPYRSLLVDRSGRFIPAGELKATTNGTLIMFQYFGESLSHVATVRVVDRTGAVVLAGQLQPYSGS
jgi:hypothetical protein